MLFICFLKFRFANIISSPLQTAKNFSPLFHTTDWGLHYIATQAYVHLRSNLRKVKMAPSTSLTFKSGALRRRWQSVCFCSVPSPTSVSPSVVPLRFPAECTFEHYLHIHSLLHSLGQLTSHEHRLRARWCSRGAWLTKTDSLVSRSSQSGRGRQITTPSQLSVVSATVWGTTWRRGSPHKGQLLCV